MADKPDDMTLHILCEMRDEMKTGFERVDIKLSEMHRRLDNLVTQMLGVSGMLTLIYGKQMGHA